MENIKIWFLDLLIENEVILKEDKEIYEFGLITFFFMFVKFIILFILFYFVGELTGFLGFVLGFSLLRLFSGGHHFESALACFFVTLIQVAIVIAFGKYLYSINAYYIPQILSVLALIIVLKYAPGKVKKRPLTNLETKKFRRISISIVILLTIMINTSLMFDKLFYELYIISLSMFLQTITIISKRSVKNEKKIISDESC